MARKTEQEFKSILKDNNLLMKIFTWTWSLFDTFLVGWITSELLAMLLVIFVRTRLETGMISLLLWTPGAGFNSDGGMITNASTVQIFAFWGFVFGLIWKLGMFLLGKNWKLNTRIFLILSAVVHGVAALRLLWEIGGLGVVMVGGFYLFSWLCILGHLFMAWTTGKIRTVSI